MEGVRLDVLCLGTLTIDIFLKKGGRLPMSFGDVTLLEAAELHPGGTACNAALDFAKLGLSVGVVTHLGDDAAGDLVVNRLSHAGVQLRGVTRDRAVNTTATFYTTEPDGTLAYLYYPGASETFAADDVDLQLIAGAKFLHVGGTFLMPALDGPATARILEVAQAAGVKTSLDPTPNVTPDSLEIIAPSLPHLDFFFPNLVQAQVISGQKDPGAAAAFFLEQGVGTVSIKLDRHGSYVTDGQRTFLVPPYRVVEVETTGAGDAYAAGFITGIWSGWDLEKAAYFANAVGAMCVRAAGAQAGVGSINETLQFMREQGRLTES